MATIFTRAWTGGVNGQSWSTVGWTQVTSGAFAPLIQSEAGWGPGTSGTEMIWRATAYPQTTGYSVDADCTWKDAAGAGRYVGIATRCAAAGTCYSCELDSNVGTTRVRIRRRSAAGAWTTVSAWASPVGAPNSAALNSGVTLTAKVQNTASTTVTVTFKYGSTTLATYADTSADRLESGGTAGIVLDANWSDDDIIVDNVLVRDFEADWAGAGSLSTDTALCVDGTWYSWDDLNTAGILIGTPRQSYTIEPVCQLRDTCKIGATSSVLYTGAIVKVALDGTVVAFGRLRSASESWDPAEGRTYELVGPKQLGTDTLVRDPEWGTDVIRFNMSTDAEDYDSTRADFEIGEAIEYLIDNHLEGDGGLRDQLAAPPDGDAYDSAVTALMTTTIPDLQVSGDVVQAVEELLAYTKYSLLIDPSTREWKFKERQAGTITQIDLDTQHVTGETRDTTDRNFTAVEIIGSRPDYDITELTSAAGLVNGWDASLEASTTLVKALVKNRDTGIVDSIGVGAGGRVTMTATAALVMTSDEWIDTYLKFTSGGESGNTYKIYDNSSTTFTFYSTSWTSGGPAATDTFEVYGVRDQGTGQDNGYRQVGRRYKLNDVDLGIVPGVCAQVELSYNGTKLTTTATTYTPTDPALPAEINLALPSMSLINFTGDTVVAPGDAECAESPAALTFATVKATVPTYSRSDPSVPTYRYPTSGFTGTAYTTDPTKWSGAGKPGKGDPAIMRVYSLQVPGYDGSQDAEMAVLAQDLLTFLSPLSREVRITFDGIDVQWAGLGRRLQVIRSGGGSTGIWSTITDLDVQAVEWDPMNDTTTVYAGTIAAWDYDVQKMRAAFVSKSAIGHQKAMVERLRELLECINQNMAGRPDSTTPPPTMVCAETVMYAAKYVRGGQRDEEKEGPQDVPEKLDALQAWLEFITWLEEYQKGLTINMVNGVPEIVVGGNTYYFDDFDNVFRLKVGVTPDPDTDPSVAGLPGMGADGFPTTGAIGALWDAIVAILGNLGKSYAVSTDPVTGIPAVTVGKPGETIAAGTPGVVFTPPCHDAGPISLYDDALDFLMPGNTTTQGQATQAAQGLSPGTGGGGGGSAVDPGGQVLQDWESNLWRAEPVTPGSYDDGATWVRQQPAAGGAGTGKNKGDYEDHVTPLDFIPRRAKNLDDGTYSVSAEDAADAVANSHTQGTDQALDTGGANEATAADVHALLDATDASGAADGDVLTADGAGAFAWEAVPAPEGTAVLSTGPEDAGDVLTADGAGGASWEPPAGGAPEGTSVLSTGEGAGEVLTADGANGASWEAIPAPEGTDVLSTGPVTDGYVLTADGAGAAAWEAVPAVEGADVLSTGPATDGYVLTADGAGAAAWEAPAGDMLKATYDTDADNQVEAADYADDADTVDGSHAADFATSGHNHSGTYQPIIAVYPSSVMQNTELKTVADADGGWIRLTPTTSSTVVIQEAVGFSGVSVAVKSSFSLPVPVGFVHGTHTLTVRIRAQYATAAETSTEIDLEAYTDDGGGSDVCSTAAQALTASYANYDFSLTTAAIAEGEVVHLVLIALMDDTDGSNSPLVRVSRASMVVAAV